VRGVGIRRGTGTGLSLEYSPAHPWQDNRAAYKWGESPAGWGNGLRACGLLFEQPGKGWRRSNKRAFAGVLHKSLRNIRW
jgi:hypothetical protein